MPKRHKKIIVGQDIGVRQTEHDKRIERIKTIIMFAFVSILGAYNLCLIINALLGVK